MTMCSINVACLPNLHFLSISFTEPPLNENQQEMQLLYTHVNDIINALCNQEYDYERQVFVCD
jgi:hypothetical protein